MDNIYNNAFVTITEVREKNNGLKINSSGAIYDKNGRIVIDSLRRSEFAGIKHIADSYIYITKPDLFLKGEYIYAGHCHNHFGHYLIETLPELYYAVKSRKRILFQRFLGQMNAVSSSHSLFFLNFFGISLNDVVFVDKFIQIESLEVNERIVTINNSISPSAREAYQFVSNSIYSDYEYEKIFLSRSRLKQDKRGSTEELDLLMEKKGFLVIHPQEINISEQIKIIKNASVIAGYDGSALHLSAFMKSGGKVVVMGERRNTNTKMINDLLGHETLYADFAC